MKAAILINHYTAALFYNDILTSLGFQTYIPCQCGIEPLTMQEQSKLIRTIPHDEEISILDKYDFYLPATLTERKKIAMILNSKFDLIFTYHPINVNEYLLNSATKVYFIIWGDISNDHFMHYRWKKYFFSSSVSWYCFLKCLSALCILPNAVLIPTDCNCAISLKLMSK